MVPVAPSRLPWEASAVFERVRLRPPILYSAQEQFELLNLALELGQVNEAVMISGEAQEVVNTTSPTLTNVINTRQVRDLPLRGRDPLDLARLQAGVAVTGDNPRTASVGGLRGSATNVTQDGINAMDNFVKTDSFTAISTPSLNSIREFSVTIGTVGSDAGRGVAQVNMVTASGTNEFHGGIFWQHRNDVLNANSFFNNASGTPKQIQRQNFFGGTIGGPLRFPKKAFGPLSYDGRNRSFWFFSYEGYREPFSLTRNRTVLTREARQGLFRYAENILINQGNGLWAFDPNLRVPYVQQWSLGIECEIAPNTAIEVRYVGNHAIKLFRAIDYNEVNIFENGFLQEFLNAQKNLQINGGTSFAPGRAGTVALPILDKLFAGLAAAQGYASTGFINQLNNNNAGTLAGTLAFSPTYRANRASLAPNFFVANPNAAFARALTNNFPICQVT